MKKSILSAGILAMLVAGCSNNEVLDNGTTTPTMGNPDVIGANVSTGKVSRAVSYAVQNLMDDANGFNVIAFDNDASSKKHRFSDAYKWNKTTMEWEWGRGIEGAEADLKKWPKEAGKYPMYFYAYYPNSIQGITESNLKYTPTIATSAKDQIDYLFAYTKVSDMKDKPITGNVSLNFKHILSKMNFKVAVGANRTVAIQSIKIVNVGNSGNSYNYDVETGQWKGTSPTSGSQTYTHRSYGANDGLGYTYPAELKGGSTAPVTSEVPGNSEYLMLLPQGTGHIAWDVEAFKVQVADWTNTNSLVTSTEANNNWYQKPTSDTPSGMKDATSWNGARVEVVYRMWDSTTGKDYAGWTKGADMGGGKIADKDLYIRVGYSLDLAKTPWKAGNMYTYTIKLGSKDATGGTLLDPDFKDGTGTNQPDKPVDNPAKNPGDPVNENDVIGFDVTVDEWIDNSQTLN